MLTTANEIGGLHATNDVWRNLALRSCLWRRGVVDHAAMIAAGVFPPTSTAVLPPVRFAEQQQQLFADSSEKDESMEQGNIVHSKEREIEPSSPNQSSYETIHSTNYDKGTEAVALSSHLSNAHHHSADVATTAARPKAMVQQRQQPSTQKLLIRILVGGIIKIVTDPMWLGLILLVLNSK